MNAIKPVTEADQFAFDAKVAARINAEVRRKGMIAAFQWATVAASVLAGASGWIVWATNPRIERDIEYVPIAEDGTPLMALRDEEMPPEARKINVQNSVINYVLRREGFIEAEADKNWDIVSRMSSKEVRDIYQQMNDMSNKDSQWKTYSGGGWIKVAFDSMEDLALPTGYKDVPPAYFVRFCMQEKKKDKTIPERAELWGATVTFKYDVKGYDGRFIRAYNPGKIQVTDYPNVRKIGPLTNNNGNPRGNGCSGLK